MPLSFLAPLPISRLPARLDVSPRRPRSIPVAVSRPTPPPPPPPPPSQKDPLKDESAASSATRDDTPDKLSNIQIFGERLRDTVGDAYVHYARIAGAQRRGSRSFDSDDGESTAVGTVEYRSIVEPVRTCQPEADYFEAFASDIDPDRQVVHCTPGKREVKGRSMAIAASEPFEIPYDTLVVAVGETTSTFGVSGAREHALFLKEIDDARLLRARILECLEKAKLPNKTNDQRRQILHFVIVGGGPTGCEFAGELWDLLEDLKPKYGEEFASMIQVTLLQSGDSLLTQFEKNMQDSAVESFQERINVVFGARVVEVTDSEVLLRDGRHFPYGMLVWAAGNGTRPIIGRLLERISGGKISEEDAVSKRMKLPVDPWLRVKGVQNILALGDCSLMEGEPLPATAQVAGQQGAFIGRLLSRGRALSGPGAPLLRDAAKQIKMHRVCIMASIGNNQAIVQVEAVESAKVAIGGLFGWLLWLSAYATKQVNTRSRILVLFDVAKARIWGRDLSQF